MNVPCSGGSKTEPYDRRPLQEPRRMQWINHFPFQNIRYPQGIWCESHCTSRTKDSCTPRQTRSLFVRIPCDTAQISITYFNYNRLKTRLTERAPQDRRG